VLYTSASDSKKSILDLLKHAVTDSKETVLMKGLNLAVVNPHSNLHVLFAIELVVSKHCSVSGKGDKYKKNDY
jgi:hypothetical protein